MSRLLRALKLGVLGLLGAVVVAALSQPWWLAPWISHRLSASSGRAVHFDSMWVGLSSAFQPVVHCRGVRIANAAWADARRPMVALERVRGVFSWRSFSEHRPVLALLVIENGEVDLELQADGLRNWRLQHPEDRAPGRVKLLAIEARQAQVRYVNRRIELELEAHASANASSGSPSNGIASSSPASSANVSRPDAASSTATPHRAEAEAALPLHLELKGTLRNLAFSGAFDTEETLTFMETDRRFRLRGGLVAGGTRLDLDGRAADILREPTIDAQVAWAGNSLAAFHEFVGPRPADRKPFHVEGRLVTGEHAYALSSARVQVGATVLTGEAAFKQASPRNALRADLHSDSAVLADLLWLAGRSPSSAGVSKAAKSVASTASAPKAAETKPSPDLAKAATGSGASTVLQTLDADIRFEARRFVAAPFAAVRSIALQAALLDRRLTISALDLGLVSGHLTGRALLDLQVPEGKAEADLAVHGIRLEDWWRPASNDKRLTGAVQGRAEVKAAGMSPAAWLQSASGRITARLSEGTIPSLLDAEMGLQGGKILSSMLRGSQPVPVRCAAAVVDLHEGRGTVRTLVVDTERTRLTATGSIDLPHDTLDLVLTPEAKQGGLLVLDRSIRLHGPWLKPGHDLIDRVQPSAAAGQACPR